MLKIKNLKTGETVNIERDVCHRHPEWVHEQCGTEHESGFQQMLDQIDPEAYVGHSCDSCGIFWEE